MNFSKKADCGFEEFILATRRHKRFRQTVGIVFRGISKCHTLNIKSAHWISKVIVLPIGNTILSKADPTPWLKEKKWGKKILQKNPEPFLKRLGLLK